MNCSLPAIRLCADKLALHEFCEQHGITSIPTIPLGPELPWLPAVVKRRDGAGSIDMRTITAPEASRDYGQQSVPIANQLPEELLGSRFVVQPFVSGRALSVAGLFADGELQSLFPAAEQFLSGDGCFQYLGGEIPARNLDENRVAAFVSDIGRRMEGLQGYVGFDVLWTSNGPLLVEINPRLTTSYVGYRRLCTGNLAAHLLSSTKIPAPCFSGTIRFRADGSEGSAPFPHLG